MVHSGEKKPNSPMITSLVLLSQHKLLLVDYYNRMLKLLEVESNCITHKLETTGQPWDATALPDDHAAITIPNEHKIMVVSINGQYLSIAGSIQVNDTCQGMCYHDQKLYVTYCSPGKVETLDLDGNVVCYIDSFHQPNLFHVTVFNDNDKTNICVSDNSTHRITILNLFKTLDWRLHTLNGNNPRGVVTLCSGVIGVCSVTFTSSHAFEEITGRIKSSNV